MPPASSPSRSRYCQPETVRVVAPATLAEGFSFEATVDGSTFVVVVPEGGVKEGQEFEVPYPGSEEALSDVEQEVMRDEELGIPHGKWRTSLCSCCDVVTQATFWMGFLCTPVLLAQIMTRLKLTWRGREGTPEEAAMSFNRVVITFIITLYFFNIPIIGWLVPFGFAGYMIYAGIYMRNFMRNLYEIPAGALGAFGEYADDCCCMFWCCCCSAIQMARHTHDDKEWPGTCCTTNGLELDAPDVV